MKWISPLSFYYFVGKVTFPLPGFFFFRCQCPDFCIYETSLYSFTKKARIKIETAPISSTAITAHDLTQWSMNWINVVYKNLFSTSQETHYKDQLKIPCFSHEVLVCECWDFHGSVIEDHVLLGYDAASLHNRFPDVSKENSAFERSGTVPSDAASYPTESIRVCC